MSLHIRMNGVRNKMVRGMLLIFALVFLFQCSASNDSAKDDNPTLVTLELSTPEITFSDVGGATGATYMISASRPPSKEKTIEITLTSTNELLAVSPTKVTFTSTNASPQMITVKRANGATNFITTKITGTINHVITTDTEFTKFAIMKSTVNVMVTPYIPDSDGDGLIEIWNATMLDNMRYDLAGTSYKASAMDADDSRGCPDTGCNGYELMANIDLLPLLDANTNGEIDMMPKTVAGKDHTVIDVGSDKDTSWSPVGDNSTSDDANRFTGTFEGNGNTIANLWVNISSSGSVYAGLLGVTGGSAEIRNVGVISGGVSSSSHSGGLVGRSFSSLTITNSYFSGSGGVSSSASASSYSGGLVGRSDASLMITNSYSSGSGGVSSSSSSSSSSSLLSSSGGLVGRCFSSLTITNSYFSGSGGVSSSASAAASSYSGGLVSIVNQNLTITNSYFSGSGVSSSSSSSSLSSSGGLVGRSSSSLTITNSYFSGSDGVSSSADSGGLVGFSPSADLVIMNSYWNIEAPQSADGGMTFRDVGDKRARGNDTADPMGAVRLTLTELKATGGTFPALGPAWVLGTDQQLPAVKQCALNTAMTSCPSPAMYGALLGGQR